MLLRHNHKSELFEGVGEVIGGSCQVAHDGTVTTLAKTNELVVLSDNVRSTLGEVERERSLICAKVVDVENELLHLDRRVSNLKKK